MGYAKPPTTRSKPKSGRVRLRSKSNTRKTSSYRHTNGTANLGTDQFAQTPDYIIKPLHKEFKFNSDPCPAKPKFDGLTVPWGKRNYLNPPYKTISPWVQKAVSEMQRGNLSVFLIPFRPQTLYFKDVIWPYASEIRFLKERVQFKNYDAPAPFAVVIVVFRPGKVIRSSSNFNILDMRQHGGRRVADLLKIFQKEYKFDYVVQSARANTPDVAWGKCSFICSTLKVKELIDRSEEEAHNGNVVILVVPMRTEASYFLPQVIQGKCRSIHAIHPTLICKGYTAPAMTGSMALVYGPGPKKKFPSPKLLISSIH